MRFFKAPLKRNNFAWLRNGEFEIFYNWIDDSCYWASFLKVNDFSFLIGGEAGAGVTRSGLLFAKSCMRGGLYVFGTNDYQSLIRGGHNFYVARVSDEKVYSQTDFVSLVIALNAETATLHKDEIMPNGGAIFDKDEISISPESLGREDLKLYAVPLKKIVREELKEQPIMRNTVALGAAFALTGYDLRLLEEVIRDEFKAEVAESNIKAARIGYNYVKENFSSDFEYKLKAENIGKRQILLNGNEAVGLGALGAGCKFYASYPMTPTTGLLHFMVANDRAFNMIVMQPEGEIAAVNMAAGAAFTGVRAMTATSGGGFCLMSESLGMTGMTETPIVIMVGQRTGPSTGLPTYTAQGDLRFVIHASQGEFPRVVIAPGDVEECFYETMRAFNWAEKYQLPVILLMDKYLLESEVSVEPFDVKHVRIERGDLIMGHYGGAEEYRRYKVTDTGVSPRAVPLTRGAMVKVTADEHDEYGFTSEAADMTAKMMDKRVRKLFYLAKEIEENGVETSKFYGAEDSEATVISWGSAKGPVLEAVKLLSREGRAVGFLQILYLIPFPTGKVRNVFDKARKTIVVECDRTSQLSSLIREHALKDVDHKILKYDGRPFSPVSLAGKIREVL